jgi:hypothetical protein
MMRHYRDVAFAVLENRLVYRIPLYLPQERHLFQTTELVLEVPFKYLPEIMNVREINRIAEPKPAKTYQIDLEKKMEMQ